MVAKEPSPCSTMTIHFVAVGLGTSPDCISLCEFPLLGAGITLTIITLRSFIQICYNILGEGALDPLPPPPLWKFETL